MGGPSLRLILSRRRPRPAYPPACSPSRTCVADHVGGWLSVRVSGSRGQHKAAGRRETLIPGCNVPGNAERPPVHSFHRPILLSSTRSLTWREARQLTCRSHRHLGRMALRQPQALPQRLHRLWHPPTTTSPSPVLLSHNLPGRILHAMHKRIGVKPC